MQTVVEFVDFTHSWSFFWPIKYLRDTFEPQINQSKKIITENLFSTDEKFGLLYEDMEVRIATFASNKIMQNKCTTLNSQIWGIDYITSQQTVAKFDK